ncbi:MAG TPA: hypothetical protein VF755_28790 [Catenuloplanes sp.]|jgi:hypothetical protein
MGGFIGAAFSFPTVLFTFLLVVVVGYWLLVVLGAADLDGDAGLDGGVAGLMSGLGLGGVPAAVAGSLLIALTWFLSLVGTVLVGDEVFPLASLAVLLAALAVGWFGTRLVVPLLRRALPTGSGPSRAEFVGRTCVVRTGRVDRHFGQAEVTTPDGSSALVQVRQAAADPLPAGTHALIYGYDGDGEFFWIVPADAALHPDPRHPEPPATA